MKFAPLLILFIFRTQSEVFLNGMLVCPFLKPSVFLLEFLHEFLFEFLPELPCKFRFFLLPFRINLLNLNDQSYPSISKN